MTSNSFLFGGAKAMKVTWLVAIKEEAAREGLAHEEHIVQLLNQHVEEVIVLDSDDEADDGGRASGRAGGRVGGQDTRSQADANSSSSSDEGDSGHGDSRPS